MYCVGKSWLGRMEVIRGGEEVKDAAAKEKKAFEDL